MPPPSPVGRASNSEKVAGSLITCTDRAKGGHLTQGRPSSFPQDFALDTERVSLRLWLELQWTQKQKESHKLHQFWELRKLFCVAGEKNKADRTERMACGVVLPSGGCSQLFPKQDCAPVWAGSPGSLDYISFCFVVDNATLLVCVFA